MQVICINGSWRPEPSANDKITPVDGENYNTINTHRVAGRDFYSLEGFFDWYAADSFAPVNGPDEVEMAKERENKAVDRARKLQPVGAIVLFIILYLLS